MSMFWELHRSRRLVELSFAMLGLRAQGVVLMLPRRSVCMEAGGTDAADANVFDVLCSMSAFGAFG